MRALPASLSLLALNSLALSLGGCAGAATAPVTAVPPAASAASSHSQDAAAPDTMRWLYGSGEAAGVSIQAYRMLADYAIASAGADPAQSVPLGLPDAEGGTGTVSCTSDKGRPKQPAVIFDADETAILNRGYEYWQASSGKGYDPREWKDWATNGAPYVDPVPGAVTGIKRLRNAGIAVIFNTNRNAADAAGTEAALDAAGVGPAKHGETLFMRGDDNMGSRKDGRRAAIAARYCVLALAGDNLGDFADLFNAKGLTVQDRREAASRGKLAQLWGNGWFALPNPVYGDSIRGTVNDVFPPEARWTPRPPAIMNGGK